MIARLVSWWTHDPRMARRATQAAIRQEAEMHPAEKGENWRDYDDETRARDIIEVLRECDQRPTIDAIARQFRFETGRDLPEMWKRAPPAWLRRRIDKDAPNGASGSHASVDHED